MFSHNLAAAAAVALLGLSGVASAQNASTSYPYYVPPSSFEDPQMLSYICTSQNNQCRTLCYKGLQPGSPFCDPETLMWNCECANGPTPDITEFNGTVPFFECQQYVAQCQIDNTDDPQQQQQCLKIPCGGKNATQYVAAQVGTTPSTPSPTSQPGNGGSGNGGNGGSGSGSGPGSGSGSGSGSGGNNEGSGGGDGDAASGLDVAKSYSLALFVGTAMILFGVGVGL